MMDLQNVEAGIHIKQQSRTVDVGESSSIVPGADSNIIYNNGRKNLVRALGIVMVLVVAAVGVVATSQGQVGVAANNYESDQSKFTLTPDTATCSEAYFYNEDKNLCFDDGEMDALVPLAYLIGSQKCATSSLAVQMKDVFPRYAVRPCGSMDDHSFKHTDERQYFDRYENFEGTQPCAKFFDCAANLEEESSPFYTESGSYSCDNSNYVMMDYSPNYLADFDTVWRVQRMYESYADAMKFMVVLRDPTDRVVSFFKHFQPHHDINTWIELGMRTISTTGTNCDDIALSIISTSHPLTNTSPEDNYAAGYAINAICASAYVIHLRRWAEAFEPHQFLLLSFTKYLDEPGKTLAAIGDHLNIASKAEQYQLVEDDPKPPMLNDAAYHLKTAVEDFNYEMSASTKQLLADFYKPYDDELYEYAQNGGFKTAFTHERTGKPVLF